MPLPSSGQISASEINVELSLSSTATINLDNADVRELADVSSGAISFSDLHGKSAQHLVEYGGQTGQNHIYADCDFGPEFSGRRVFVAIYTADGTGAADIDDVVIGGVNATGHDAGYQDGAGNLAGVGIFFADASGESGEVSFEVPVNVSSHIVVFTLGGGVTSQFDTDNSRNDSNPGGSTTVDVDTDGIVITAYNSTNSLNPSLVNSTRQLYGLYAGSRFILGFDTEVAAELGRVVSTASVAGAAYCLLTSTFT